jgi:hypothetical protein
MTPQEFANKMREFASDADIESGHEYADALMCSILRQLGYGDGVDVFVNMDKWYA